MVSNILYSYNWMNDSLAFYIRETWYSFFTIFITFCGSKSDIAYKLRNE